MNLQFQNIFKKRLFSTSCGLDLKAPLNKNPIGYIKIPGQVPYETGLKVQKYLVDRRHQINQKKYTDDLPADMICFLEHEPTFTGGRRIRGNSKEFENLGAAYFETMRGGQVTFHGPGQIVAYPILDIRDYQLSVRCYVSRLEKTIIDCCARYDIQANTTEHTGVWIGQERKIAAIGIHLQRYVSSHGIALNCNVDLDWYNKIVPCGLEDKQVTSITKELGLQTSTTKVLPDLIKSFEKLFFKDLIQVDFNDILLKSDQFSQKLV